MHGIALLVSRRADGYRKEGGKGDARRRNYDRPHRCRAAVYYSPEEREGSVDAIGPGLSYTTLIDKTPVTLNLRYYHEFDAHDHFQGDSTIASGTVRF